MARLRSTGTRRMLRVLALATIAIGGIATLALATGPGGWDHLGDRGTAGSRSLDVAASVLEPTPGALYVGGRFTNAGGVPAADRIAKWNGSSWSAIGPSAFPGSAGSVDAIAVDGGNVYVGGTFKDAGGNNAADHLAVWDGTSWKPFCDNQGPGPASFDGNVTSLQIIDGTLYVGGEFHDGAGIASADSLVACDLATGASRTTVADPVDPLYPFSGPVLALAADSDGRLYAGGRFGKVDNTLGADNVAYLDGGGWHAMGSGFHPCECAINGFVRALTADGTNVYVGTDESNVANLPRADHVAKWNGSAWSALGSDTGGTNGWFSTSTSIYGLTAAGRSRVFATGSFQNANADARADEVAWFDGTDWHPVGSNGAGNGPLNAEAHGLALFNERLYAAGSFTSAGGDNQAQFAASFALSNIIAVPTPTVTPGPSAVATPTVTPAPSAAPTPDIKAPRTLLRKAKIDQAKRKATFRFASGERGSKFLCKLDKKKYKPCTSPKTYKKLKRGKHVFRVKARDRAGNVDRTPMVKRFRIKRQPAS
jgi:hypothetical protein